MFIATINQRGQKNWQVRVTMNDKFYTWLGFPTTREQARVVALREIRNQIDSYKNRIKKLEEALNEIREIEHAILIAGEEE